MILLVLLGSKFFGGAEDATFEVNSALPKIEDLSIIVTATGTIEPINQVEVGTQVSGVVKSVYFDFNDQVKKGDLLLELDKSNLSAAVKEAEASYNSAMIKKKYLEKLFQTQLDLYESGSLTKNNLDETEYNLEAAKIEIIQRKTDWDRSLTNLSYASIYSPIDGVVLSRDIEVGQTVAASYSTPTLFKLARDLNEMIVEADVDEADVGSVKVGQPVIFTVDAFPEKIFEGDVAQIRLSPTITSNVVTYTVIINAKNDELLLMPGLTATVQIYTSHQEKTLTVPMEAVLFKPTPEELQTYGTSVFKSDASLQSALQLLQELNNNNKTYLWVKTENGIIPTEVSIGLQNNVGAEILTGLNQQDRVISSIKQSEESVDSNTGGSPFLPKPPGKK